MSTISDATRLQEFFDLFGNDTDRQSPEQNRIHLARMHGLAVSGGNCRRDLIFARIHDSLLDEAGFRGSSVRSVCWRVFLGVLPHDDTRLENWVEVLTGHRKAYAELCERFLVDPHKQGDAGDLLINNPLAQVAMLFFRHISKS
jgi:hypothetical protein